VALHLRAEAEDEASARGGLQIPRDLRVDERAPREGDRDVGPERDALGRPGRALLDLDRTAPQILPLSLSRWGGVSPGGRWCSALPTVRWVP
jgi:hypothetical protein